MNIELSNYNRNILLITSSTDHTCDYITNALPCVFRFNVDLHQYYSLICDKNGIKITDPVEREYQWNFISPTSFVWWRKPSILDFGSGYNEADDDIEKRIEITQLMSEIFRLHYNNGLILGDKYARSLSPDKVVQSVIFSDELPVPDWCYCLKSKPSFSGFAVKKYLSTSSSSFKATTLLPELNDSILLGPFYIQRYIRSVMDVTTFICHSQCSSYYKTKNEEDEVDWRVRKEANYGWKKTHLSDWGISTKSLIKIMQNKGFDYGRIDWVVDEDNKIWFLEINANGQFMWLEPGLESSLITLIRDTVIGKIKQIQSNYKK